MTRKRAKQEGVEAAKAIFTVEIVASFLFTSDSNTNIAESNFSGTSSSNNESGAI